jgi:hypothetical protein
MSSQTTSRQRLKFREEPAGADAGPRDGSPAPLPVPYHLLNPAAPWITTLMGAVARCVIGVRIGKRPVRASCGSKRAGGPVMSLEITQATVEIGILRQHTTF